ncbi:hypothetical protein HO133_008061 [Letharia lupina]|uniref:Gal80p-like C-terminal domain-containing protein n=1 Tax=Letharia lupina TaxID=560253 RepID=A0A8H6CSA8_9LECA|nr:uncharacterized protein HO133_008061 [Letharia lupina]KAF6228331.1 hypothetical protein HO133_008061 [Letharia lupina]
MAIRVGVDGAEELDALAKENNARTMIGLQGELSPLILKVKSLIEQENKIGKVLSSSIIAAGGTRTRDSIVEGLRYFTRRIVGGNIITIGLRHMIDFVMLVLGELSAFRSPLNIQRPQVPIMGSDGTVIESVATDVADHIMLLGLLSSGAPLSVTFRRGPPFKGTPGFIWSIHGEKGEIRITATGPALQANDVETKLTLHTFDQEEVEVIEWDRHFKDPPRPARNVAAMYEAFANRETEKYPDCTHAVLRHRQIEEVFKSAEEGRRGVYLG